MSKVIIVGASSGIGRELAKLFRKDGCEVGVMARRVEKLQELNVELGGGLQIAKADLLESETAMAALRELIGRMGGVDVVVLSSGTGDINGSLKWEVEEETIRTNAVGFAAMANVAAQNFLLQGSGQLVGISSVASLRGARVAPAYNASKAFISNYMEGLRQKFAHTGKPLYVTDIRPGFVQTAMAKGPGVFWSAPVEKAAGQIYKAIRKKRRVAYITRRWWLVAQLFRILPGFLHDRL